MEVKQTFVRRIFIAYNADKMEVLYYNLRRAVYRLAR